MIGRPAQKTKPAGSQIGLAVTAKAPGVEVLRFPFESRGARFKNQHIIELLRQLDGQSNSGGATTDDRNSPKDIRGFGQLASVDEHYITCQSMGSMLEKATALPRVQV